MKKGPNAPLPFHPLRHAMAPSRYPLSLAAICRKFVMSRNGGAPNNSSDFRSTLPRFTPEALKANQAPVDLLGRIAAEKNASPAQIALAWLLAQKPWIVPIPGTTKLERLDENIGALAVELTTDDLREIDSAAAQITVHGNRYPEKLEQLTGR
nr:aldo/keto reductase [Geobacter sp.]